MPYIDTNTRTTAPLANEKLTQLGRFQLLHGVYVGFIKDAVDVQRNGRLRVWIPEFGTAPEEEQGWMIVNYCSPFAGATNVETASSANTQTFEGTQTSYGMWMIPPDINNQVLVMFANGDPARGFWIGSIYNQYMNNMIPGMASSSSNYQYPGKDIPVAEYNKKDTSVTQPDRVFKPYEATKFKGLGNQGLITDQDRGITKSSARRESPSSVFGIITPGPVIDTKASPASIRRKGGSSFIMDDAIGSEYVQLTTKTGAQIRLDETDGFVYLINRDGTAWVQMDKDGNIDIFGAMDITMRAQRDFNVRADRNVNIEAGQNIFMKAAKDTKEETTTFTYDVNNIPQPSTIPVWAYKGEGEGDGGSIVMQALNNWHSTAKNSAYLTVIDNNMEVCVGNSFSLTTQNGEQDFNSKKGIKMTTDAAFDFAATGNIRVGSNGSISVVGEGDIIFCTNSSLSFNAQDNIQATAVNDINLTSSENNIDAVLTVTGTANVLVTGAVIAGSLASPSASTATTASPIQSEAALSAAVATKAEIKPMNDKVNILATWFDPESKFKRNTQALQTTVSRFPTYEPCPEHENFSFSNVAGYSPAFTTDDKTYEGSSGKGNNVNTSPAASVNPGSNNTSVPGDPSTDDIVSKDININALRNQLIIHEGLVKKVYLDTTNLPHAGIGHLLRTNEIAQYPVGSPVSDEQIETWYTQDSNSAIKIAQDFVGDSWNVLSDIRKRAVTDLAYNLGKVRLGRFVNFRASMKSGNYNNAGKDLRDSSWFTQVGRRGPNIVTMIVQNVDPTCSDKKFPG